MKKQILTKVAIKGFNGCAGCIYNINQGLLACNHSNECVAHNRPDKESIIFVYENYLNRRKK